MYVFGGGRAHKQHTWRLLMNYLRYWDGPCSSIVYSRSDRWVLGDCRVCATTARAWLRVGVFLLRKFRTGISGRDRSGSAFVCAAREGWCDEVWDFFSHPRISSGIILGTSLHYCTVRDCGDRWKCREPSKHIQMSHWSCPEITSILTHESLCIKI
jgi:hypothetical protein